MIQINWPEFMKKEFPKGKLINGRNGKELNIDCISDECPNPNYHMFVNLGSKSPKHNKRFVCHRCGFSGNHKAFLTAYYGLPYKTIVENLSDLYGREIDPYTYLVSISKGSNNLSYESIEVEKTSDRYINTFYVANGEENQEDFVGVEAMYSYQNK